MFASDRVAAENLARLSIALLASALHFLHELVPSEHSTIYQGFGDSRRGIFLLTCFLNETQSIERPQKSHSNVLTAEHHHKITACIPIRSLSAPETVARWSADEGDSDLATS